MIKANHGYMVKKRKKKSRSPDELPIDHSKISETIDNLERSISNMHEMDDAPTSLFRENLSNLINDVQGKSFKDAKRYNKDTYRKGVELLKFCAGYASENNLGDLVREVFDSYSSSHRKKEGIFGKEYFEKLLSSSEPAPNVFVTKISP